MEERLSDDAGRKKFLEDEVKGFHPGSCEVELSNPSGLESFHAAARCGIHTQSPG